MDFELPYASRRMPVLAANVVATSQPLAAQAGLRMLLSGGNAVDAALATAIALAIVEPTSNGIGSDAFAILWDGERLHGLNASGRSPAALTPDRFAGRAAMPRVGWDTVTVPGAVSAWVELSGRFGRLPFEHLFEPAIAYARDGFLVAPVTARAWSNASEVYAGFEEFRKHFLPQGRAPRAGERFRYEEQACTLEHIAKTRGEAFYTGDLASAMARASRDQGGLLSEEDLSSHRVDWVGTLSTGFDGIDLHEIPPNGQGLAALIMLGILRHHPAASASPDSADGLHVQIEAMKLAFADAHRYIADPATMDLVAGDLLDDGYLAERAGLIDMKRAREPVYGVPRRGGTVYLSAADADGMMVSFIQSNYQGFGSGVVVPGTGIVLQNRGSGFTLEPGHPNQVGGGKRPFHTIIPGFVTRRGQPVLSFGVMGGPMQPQGHAQMVLRIFRHGQNPQAASDAPRWQVRGGLMVEVEQGFTAEALDDLRGRGHQLTVRAFGRTDTFGGAQLVMRIDGGYIAASEPRKDGQAVGY